MTQDDKISKIFLEACDLPADQLAAFLARACGEDSDLRREVMSLLEHDDAVSLIDSEDCDITSKQATGIDWGKTEFDDLPERVDRYQIQRLLGRGGYGIVCLATDEQLDRPVAIKFPHARLTMNPADAQAFLTEARTVAALDHPNIVPVYDVGSTKRFPCYVVSKFIEGTDLSQRMKREKLTTPTAAKLVATVARALHYAHQQGLVHRDIKPANILIDTGNQPYVVDFGLALKEENLGTGPKCAGTPAYMSPEQARGEGHRVDGRSDVFSLGTVLYELLTGRQPFTAQTRSELSAQIITREARPLRQYDDQIPKELERICLKALDKRLADRYLTAGDMADDLQLFLNDVTELDFAKSPLRSSMGSPPSSTSRTRPSFAAEFSIDTSSGRSGSSGHSTDSAPIKIVPKGLRSFDEHDADFFLELLPGPRDRNGLPDSLRFWKTKIEEADSEKTFSVGLIYGPSGCGKSSLVKAGLLPRLSNSIITIYVEANGDQTESRLLHGLRHRFPGLDPQFDLKQCLAALRQGGGLRVGQKILLVVDQFEQWLNRHKDLKNSPLVDALRQCNGSTVQCIIMVRDDFWMAATRFMKALEIRLSDTTNSAAVDLFQPRHARRVLKAYGRASGDLPETDAHTTKQQKEFLKRAIEGLADDGKIVCVRLALFAEMLKGKPWTPVTLKQLGGTEGVGVTFLEETFSASTAPPQHRYHQGAARAVLKSLLPESSSTIKGQMKSREDLMVVSGYESRPDDFNDLIELLDSELRLITPTEEGSTEVPHYQLAHDYLVPSIRTWLNQKQKETRKGRAELRLEERASLWTVKSEHRHLPSAWETLTIRRFTPSSSRTDVENKMLQRATRVHATRWAIAMAVVLLIGVGIQQVLAASRHRGLVEHTKTAVESLRNSRSIVVPGVIEDLKMLPSEMVVSELADQFKTSNELQKLSIAYALSDFGDTKTDFLVGFIPDGPLTEANNLIGALSHDRQTAIQRLRSGIREAKADKNWNLMARLAIAMLHLGDPSVAEDMCQLRPDPIQRTIFIDEFPRWHGELAPLSEFAKSIQSEGFRSAVCLAVGSVAPEVVSRDDKQAWQPVLIDWYLNANETGTHSASGWALRKWNLTIPKIEPTGKLENEKQWHVNQLGMTMLKIPAGSFVRNTGQVAMGTKIENHVSQDQTVHLERRFLISDREVTVAMFEQFLQDPNYPTNQKPSDWTGMDNVGSSSPQHPANTTSWYDAILFCNWLSRREGLQVCYEKNGAFESVPEFKNEMVVVQRDAWRLKTDANGYRLPTEAEWEYACRAGTNTAYSFGGLDVALENDEEMLKKFALTRRIHTSSFAIGGTLLPNSWGLFEMLGNVSEWCQDYYDVYPSVQQLVDPLGPDTPRDENAVTRVSRSPPTNARMVRCQDRRFSSSTPSTKFPNAGFRLARYEFVESSNRLDSNQQEVSISRPFLLSDSEISVGLFRQFTSDQEYARQFPDECPTDWTGESTFHSPSPEHPVQFVNWYDAIMFCNWLSRQEGLTPCYQPTGELETFSDETEHRAWKLVADTNGFRLPSEAQWELACRAGTTTDFTMGNATAIEQDPALVRQYAVCRLSRTGVCRSKLPNGWGVFDMQGNVIEWCQDWFAEFTNTGTDVVDPIGPLHQPTPPNRIARDNFYLTAPLTLRSSRNSTASMPTPLRLTSVGFRVTRPLNNQRSQTSNQR